MKQHRKLNSGCACFMVINITIFKKNFILFFRMKTNNPWNVQDLDVFLFYWCPECEEKSENKSIFINHALSAHPKVSTIYI